MSTLNVEAISHPTPGSNVTINGTTPAGTNQLGNRNKIINGDMRIDQRNAGAGVTASGAFPVDRFFILEATDGAYSSQQSSLAPSGHSKSLYFTTTTADATLASGQAVYVSHHIEGVNCEDLAWGTASAKSVVLSFKVRSSLTGTFGGAVANSARDRSYPFTYSISTADTWTDVSVAIPGDTSGTWLTDISIGIRLTLGLGVASDLSGTAGAWSGADYRSATSAVSVIGTLNATFRITGVQLEAGTVATPFEHRSYGQELSLCQRYYQLMTNFSNSFNAPGTSESGFFNYEFKVPMRQAPTVTITSTGTTSRLSSLNVTTTGIDTVSLQAVSSSSGMVYVYGLTAANASAEL